MGIDINNNKEEIKKIIIYHLAKSGYKMLSFDKYTEEELLEWGINIKNLRKEKIENEDSKSFNSF